MTHVNDGAWGVVPEKWGRSVLQRFAADQKGAAIIIFALGLGILAFSAAMAIDYGRVGTEQVRMQRALDAAALAAAHRLGTADQNESGAAAAAAFFKANTGGKSMFGLGDVALNGDAGEVTASSGGSIPTSLLNAFGISKVNIRAGSRVVRGSGSVEIALVLDNSGSMGRRVSASMFTQQEIANQAAALAVKTLAKGDLISVVVFNTETTVLVPLGPNTDPKTTTEKILSISPGGGTVMGPGLQEAWDQLKGVKAAVKHVIVMSDGRSMASEVLPGLAQRMKAEDGITVSTIGVGDDVDGQTMSAIASNTGGRYYQVSNPNLLPKLFPKAIRVVRPPLIREGLFQPVILPTASPLTAGLSDPPPLRGLVLTQKRPEPTITYSMAAPTGEPLLADWTVELGHVAAFTSDARAGGWAEPWIPWPGYKELWTTIARSMAKSASPERLELTTEVVGDELRLRLDAAGQDGGAGVRVASPTRCEPGPTPPGSPPTSRWRSRRTCTTGRRSRGTT